MYFSNISSGKQLRYLMSSEFFTKANNRIIEAIDIKEGDIIEYGVAFYSETFTGVVKKESDCKGGGTPILCISDEKNIDQVYGGNNIPLIAARLAYSGVDISKVNGVPYKTLINEAARKE
tara:strand:+ start:94 stop:453 length:360 start_codon:yes stop_codon:yes gene_type:complete